jgi:hypothetical protein
MCAALVGLRAQELKRKLFPSFEAHFNDIVGPSRAEVGVWRCPAAEGPSAMTELVGVQLDNKLEDTSVADKPEAKAQESDEERCAAALTPACQR